VSFANTNYSDIVATTLEARSGTIADNVTKNNALLALMKQKGRQRTVGGGRTIVEELSFAENANGGSYSGYDTLPTAAQDVISAAEFNWKQYAVPVTISGLEELQNAGKEQVIDLLEGRTGVAEATMANLLCVGLYGDGTGNGGKNLTGLDAAVPQDPTTGTYGGINRATWTFWRSQLAAIGGAPTAANIQGYMNTLWASCTRGKDKPDIISAGNNAWLAYLASLQPLQRFTDSNMANLGFDNIKFMSAPVVLDGGIGGAATSNDMYFLNTSYLSFRPHKARNMVPIGGKRVATNQDATVQILGWAGNLTCSGAQFQGRLKGS
jgi:hypothetical protein